MNQEQLYFAKCILDYLIASNSITPHEAEEALMLLNGNYSQNEDAA